MDRMTKNLKRIVLMGLMAAASTAQASLVFVTPAGSTAGGQPVNAQATFTFGTNSLQIVLQNFQANPTSIVQALSDLEFVINGTTSASSLTSSSGTERTIASNGTFSDGATVSTGWVFSSGGPSQFLLDVLSGPGHAGPAHLVIGPPDGSNVYSNANGSIAGNGPHNPVLANTATFNLSLTGVTSNTTISSVLFSFGTTPNDVTAEVPGTPLPSPAPEPTSLALLGIGALAAAAIRRRKQ